MFDRFLLYSYRAIALVLAMVVCWSSNPAIALARTAPLTSGRSSIQPYLDRVSNQITEFTLDNGMRFIVMERHEAPVVSFMTYVNVGAAQEEQGKTGEAHFLEHLAFKGTTQIGTTNYEAEKPLLDELDQLFDQIKAAKAAGQEAEVERLQTQFNQVRDTAAGYVKQNEMGQIVEQAGGVGLNATTSADATRYFYSFPSNKLELWMSLESERFLDPVFREFYEEKDVILEERRMRTDNSPVGRMVERFLETALPGHPYGRPIIGYAEDIQNLTRQDVQDFFQRYYTPDHIVVSVVGDVKPRQVKRLAQTYFGRFQAGSSVPDLTVTMPTQTEPKEFTLELPTQPWYFEGYQSVGVNDPNRVAYDMIASLLSDGRTSRLYQSLVEQQQLALNVVASNGFPGDRYPGLMLIYALTSPGHTLDEVAESMHRELDRLKTELVSSEELERVKTQSKAALLRTLDSNDGMASLLAAYEAMTGDWRTVFQELEILETITPEDLQRTAQTLFQPTKQTIGRLVSTP